MKNLSFPFFSAVFASLLIPVEAQNADNTRLLLGTEARYRQLKTGIFFEEATFDVEMADGIGTYTPGCAFPAYIPPGGACGGSTAFLVFGEIGEFDEVGPYFFLESITPAKFIEPRRPDRCFLTSAPASTLPRPLAGFEDNGYSIYYNLHTPPIKQFSIANYSTSRAYSKTQRAKFISDVVPGAYFYSFPKLGFPNSSVPISAQIYPMLEGMTIINNQESGFQFDKFGRWDSKGFMEVSYNKPITFSWRGIVPTSVFFTSDSLYMSLRVLSDPLDPTSPTDVVDNVTGFPQSIFPAIASGSDPRFILPSPFITSYVAPPVFAGGTRAILELRLERALKTGGVAYDTSSRTFQIPIIVVNRYSDYQDVVFEGTGSKTGILEDSDGDGYNNLNEWILDSDASQAAVIPIPPVPVLNPAIPARGELEYFGFTINQKLGTNPAVVYTLQRSTNGGRTWSKFTSDTNWIVTRTRLQPGEFPNREIDPEKALIKVESRTGLMPIDTLGDLYRVKITLR